MRSSVVVLAGLLITAPSVALAQPVPATPAPAAATTSATSPTAAQVSAGLKLALQAAQTQVQARTAMLGALTSAHRDVLAKVVGDLATASEPNFDAAAAKLDAALSPGEVEGIKRAQAAQRTQLLSEAGQLQATLQSSLTPEQAKTMQEAGAEAVRTTMAGNGIPPGLAKMSQSQNDPGYALLIAVLSGVQPYTRFLMGDSSSRR